VAFADDPEGRYRLSKPFQTLRPEIVELEQAAEQAAGRAADDHAARLRQRLQARGEVRGLTDDRFFLGSAITDQVANNH
jgi:hypothetical protein